MSAVKQILADISKLTVDDDVKENMRHRVIHTAVELKIITPEEAAELGK